MSLPAAPRVSEFTFQSAVHGDHVLRCLDEQRRGDVLCDVTVVVGAGAGAVVGGVSRSFRAHRAVLASCSRYFHGRVANVSGQDPVITLPDEVTVEGFEPLLQFAYTSKLPFTKENIHAIHSSAEFLGFHNLDSACFDFLIPKFSEGKGASQEVRRKACCRSRQARPSFSSNEESSQPESFQSHSSVPSAGDEQAECPESTQGEERFCLENCGPQMAPLSLDLTADVCPMLSLPCPDSDRADHPCAPRLSPGAVCPVEAEPSSHRPGFDADPDHLLHVSPISISQFQLCPELSNKVENKADRPSHLCQKDILEEEAVCNQSELSLADCDLPCELSTPGDANPPEFTEPASSNVKQTVETIGAETNCERASCPLGTPGDCSELLEQSGAADLSDPTLSSLSQDEGFGDRSSVEREVAEHLAKGFWSDLCPPQAQPLPLDPLDQNNLAKASDFHWLKQLDLTSSVGDCPFFRDMGTDEDPPAPRPDSLSQSEKSPYMSSSLNSGEESELDTDGDTEANNKRAAEIHLPFPVEQISVLSRSAFQQLLKNHKLTPDQLEFVHDVRRRSKNRVAAQRCRKRKQDGIQQLECEIKKLKSEKERLVLEQTQLERDLEETRHSLCGLCKTVGMESESGPAQDPLELLAQISSSPDLPVPSPNTVGKDDGQEETHIKIEMVSAAAGAVAVAGSRTQTEEAGPRHGCSDPAALLNSCLDMDNLL